MLIVPVVAVTTVATAIFIGLGFLSRPTRAAAFWSVGFAIIMSSSYVWVAYEALEIPQLRSISVGMMFSPMAMMWSGLRAYSGKRREYLWVSIWFLVALPLVMFAASFTNWYGISFRIMFAVVGIFAGLIIYELLALGKMVRDDVLPLVIGCAVYIVFGVVILAQGVLVWQGNLGNAEALDFTRSLNMIGSTVFVICYLVTLLLLVVRKDTVRRSATHEQFDAVASDRLARAKTSADPWWSVLDIRLDDPDDIRAASSAADFNVVSARFIEKVRTHLPADADIEVMDQARVICLIPRAQGGLRDIVSGLLAVISTVDPDEPVPLGVSASIGWVQVSSHGYDIDALVSAAANAAETAHAAGGDRWERLRGTE